MPAPTPAVRRPLDYRVDPFDLRLFTAVVDLGSITAGAAAMGLSLAAASGRLKALEHRVGALLLRRAKTGATVTEPGRALAGHAHRVLAELDALQVAVAAAARGLRGSVRLLCNTAAMAEALPARLGPFLRRYPDIDVDLQELPSDAVLQALRAGQADLGIVADHADTSGLHVTPWLEDELVALLPAGRTRDGDLSRRGNAAARGARSIAFVDLLERPFVGLPAVSGLSRFLAQQATRGGRVLHHRVRVGNLDAVARLVATGVGVAVVPRGVALRWADTPLRAVPLRDDWSRRRLLICQTAQAAELDGVRALVAALLETAVEAVARRASESAARPVAPPTTKAPARPRQAPSVRKRSK